MNRIQRVFSTVLAASLLFAATAADARMYRYKDENGRTVISNTVPQQASRRGYEILNSQGRVVEVIDPEPTAEELAARAAEEERQRQAELQRQADLALLKRFSHPDEAIRAMERKIQEMRGLTQLKRGNISVLVSQLDEEQGRAANLERAGRDIPESTLQKITRLQNQIRGIEREIAVQNAEIERMREHYLEDIERLEIITGEQATITPDLAPIADGNGAP